MSNRVNVLGFSFKVLLLAVVLSGRAGAVELLDPIDLNDGWTIVSGGGFSLTIGGLVPVQGDTFFYARTSSSGSRGIWKYFDDMYFAEGNYSITLWVGCQNDFAFADNTAFLLMADVNDDGIYQYSERILTGRSIITEAEPASGEWEQWEYSYAVTSASKTEGGDSVIGHQIGFLVLSSLNNTGFSADGLSIEYHPFGIQDPVDSNGGWTAITGGGFTSSVGGLTPEEGDNFFYARTLSSGNRGAWKYFDGLDSDFCEGTYRVTLQVGHQNDFSFIDNATFLLMADVNKDGVYNYSERIVDGRYVLAEPVPSSGAWEQWQYIYNITANTVTVGGDPVLGCKIGFFVLSALNNSGYSVDSLAVAYRSSAISILDAMENNDGWTAITGGGFTSSVGGLSPVEGNTLFYARTSSSGNRGAWKYFEEAEFTEGNYHVSLWAGCQNDYAFTDNVTFLLMADANHDGAYQYSERILDGRSIISEPIPASGEWAKWQYIYSITEDTVTVDNDPVVGCRIGLFVLSALDNSGYSVDSLSICSSPWICGAPGGGGFFRGPAISPHNPDVLLCADDMGGVFRSIDCGSSWQMVSFTELHSVVSSGDYPQHIWTFHPEDESRVFASTLDGLHMSVDGGASWSILTNGVSASERGPRIVGFDPQNPDYGLAVYNPSAVFEYVTVFCTTNSGVSWSLLSELDSEESDVVNMGFMTNSASASDILLSTEHAVFRSSDGGTNWISAEQGLGVSGSSLTVYDMVSAGDTVYLTRQDTVNSIGIFRADGTGVWARVQGTGLYNPSTNINQYQRLSVCQSSPENVYVTYAGSRSDDPSGSGESNVFKSSNGGSSWQPVLFQHPDMLNYNITNTSWLTGEWGWANPNLTVDVSDQNPDIAVVSSITSLYLTQDGGDNWVGIHAPDGIQTNQPAGGLPILSCWNYYFDPFNSRNHFLASTDFAGWSSDDAGQTWKYQDEGNLWPHDIYAVAYSTVTSNRLWAACSSTHDIPTWKYQEGIGTYTGGISLSDDGGATWVPVDIESQSGLPRHAVTDIWQDPLNSSVGAEVLWAAVPGDGVFYSEDGGTNWVAKNAGIATNNYNVLQVKGDDVGNLYALSTVKDTGGGLIAGALYRSSNQGASWQTLWSDSVNPFSVNFTLVPEDTNTLYVCALQKTTDISSRNGGVWKSTDGGLTWSEVFTEPAYAVAVQPGNPDRLLVSSWYGLGDGVYSSRDGGSTWERLKLFSYSSQMVDENGEGYPFWRPMQIVFHPGDQKLIYVTNFGGGVFKGRLSL